MKRHPLTDADIVLLKDINGDFKKGDRAVIREVYHIRPEPKDKDLDYRVEHKTSKVCKWIAKAHFELAPVEEEEPAAVEEAEIAGEQEDQIPPEPPTAVLAEVESAAFQLSLWEVATA